MNKKKITLFSNSVDEARHCGLYQALFSPLNASGFVHLNKIKTDVRR